MPRSMIAFVVLFLFSRAAMFAQPHSKPTTATYITEENVKEVLKGAPPKQDQQLKVVDVGTYNLGVGIIHRGATKDRNDGTAPCIIHHYQTETYIIRSGGGTLVTGGTIIDPKEVSKESEIYTTANGPSATGSVRLNEAQVRQVKPGDIIIIPPDVCHGWIGITDHVDYLSVRPDPDRVLPAGYVNPAIKR